MAARRCVVWAMTLVVALAGCAPAPAASGPMASGPTPSVAPGGSALPTGNAGFPTALFASLGDEPVADALAAELQAVLESQANGHGLTAAVISLQGTWSGATGFATGDRGMVPNDQLSIAHITQTLVAAQVMLLVEAGELSLDDLAADRLPPSLEFDSNGATIADLLSHRSGFPDTLDDPGEWESLPTDPLRAWTPEEVLPTRPERGPVGREWEFTGTNYTLLGVILEHVTGRSVADVLRTGVLSGDGYERLIYQPDERPTEPMAMPSGAAADTFEKLGGSLPSLARVTAESGEANMASDAPSLARWFTALCAGQVVSPASVDEMTDIRKRPEFGLGIWDKSYEYGYESRALGLAGVVDEGYRSVALCLQAPVMVVVVLSNEAEHDVETTAGTLWRAAGT